MTQPVDASLRRDQQRVPRILVVDDHAEMARVWELLLRMDGNYAQSANSVREALTLLQEAEWDLMVTDLILDDGSAWELCKAASELHQELPIIIITAFAELMAPIQEHYHIAAIMQKPVRPKFVLETVSTFLEQK